MLHETHKAHEDVQGIPCRGGSNVLSLATAHTRCVASFAAHIPQKFAAQRAIPLYRTCHFFDFVTIFHIPTGIVILSFNLHPSLGRGLWTISFAVPASHFCNPVTSIRSYRYCQPSFSCFWMIKNNDSRKNTPLCRENLPQT